MCLLPVLSTALKPLKAVSYTHLVVKEKENISAEVDMIECGRIVDNDTTIVVGMTGDLNKHTCCSFLYSSLLSNVHKA